MGDFSRWGKAIRDFAEWLGPYGHKVWRPWEARINSADDATVEGAVAEAVTWSFLIDRCSEVGLNEVPGKGGPDFWCRVGADRFLVEVTNISRAVVTQRTRLNDEEPGGGYYGLLTRQLFYEIMDKAARESCRSVTEPLLLAVTTLHYQASAICFDRGHIENIMTGDPYLSWTVNRTTGDVVDEPRNTVDLKHAAFVNWSGVTDGDGKPFVESVRRQFSAIMLGGFGLVPPQRNVFSALHPAPFREFNPQWLLDVECCRFRQWPLMRNADVEWWTPE